MRGSLGPPESTLQSAFQSVNRILLLTNVFNRHTDRHTDTDSHYSVCSSRQHFAIPALRLAIISTHACTWTDVRNFQQKCYWEIKQSKDYLFSHVYSLECTQRI